MAIAIKLTDLESFCTVCPPADEVTTLLSKLGFHLVFSMSAKYSKQAGKITLVLPAQFHYKDTSGTEVIYLAGKDRSERDEPYYPEHASRWWLYPGSSQYSYNLVLQSLSVKYKLEWK